MKKINPEKIKRKALKAFESGDMFDGFSMLYEFLQSREFYTYCSRKYVKEIIFWEDFMTKHELLDALNESNLIHQVIYDYFMKSNLKCQDFLFVVAKDFPSEFVKAVRRTAVFLINDQLAMLKQVELAEPYRLEQKSWLVLYKEDQKRWTRIKKLALQLKYIDLHKVLASLIFWIENERFDFAHKSQEDHIIGVYNFFISFYFSDYEVDSANFSVLKIEGDFVKLLGEKEKNRLDKLLNEISDWIKFKKNILDRFCYEDGFHLNHAQNGENLFEFNAASIDNINDKRYIVNEEIYVNIAKQQIDVLEEEGLEKIPGETEIDIDRNRYFTIKRIATINLLSDLALQEFVLDDKQIHSNQILQLIQGFSQNLFMRYQTQLEQRKLLFGTFNLAYLDVFAANYKKTRLVEAWICESENEYLQRNKGVIPDLTEKGLEELLQVVSLSIGEFETFDRFRYNYDVQKTPYIRLNDHIFCSTFLLAQNNWFYSFAQLLLKNNSGTKNQKKGTNEMEEYLTNKLVEKGWDALWLGKNDSDKIVGDVDVLVQSETTLILMQVKRNQFRTDLKSAYNERMISTRKAAQQLNLAVPHILEKFDPKREKQLEKWIVSTSFESIHTVTEECIKINYFDLLQSLFNKEIPQLSDFVTYIKRDANFQDTKKLYLKQRKMQDELFYPVMY